MRVESGKRSNNEVRLAFDSNGLNQGENLAKPRAEFELKNFR